MGNWELEVPRLVMNTGPSTILKGDIDGNGICEANGDATNNSSGRPSFTASLLNTSFKNKIEESYVNQVNLNLANQTLNSIVYLLGQFGTATGIRMPSIIINRLNLLYRSCKLSFTMHLKQM